MKTDVHFTRNYSKKKTALKPKVTKNVLKPSIFHFIKSVVVHPPNSRSVLSGKPNVHFDQVFLFDLRPKSHGLLGCPAGS